MGSTVRPSRRQSRSRRYRRSQRRIGGRVLLVIVLLLGVAAFAALASVAWDLRRVSFSAYPAPPPVRAPERTTRPDPSAMRPVFRHSVVPGGVYAGDEVDAAMKSDHVVAAHYSAVNPRELRVQMLPEDRAVYMSYRVNDRIFWTKHKVWLKQGETILTDGVRSIRARCGNCIAFAPMEPTADDEPGEMEFDALTDERDVLPSRVPFGSEVLLRPITGIPIPWLQGHFSDDFADDVWAGGSTGLMAFAYHADPADPLPGELQGGALFPVPDGEPPSFESLPPTGGPFDPHDPGDPRTPGDPGDPRDPRDPRDPGVPAYPGDPADPGDPFDPEMPPIDNPVVPAPEPATLMLVGGGLATLIARRRRK